MKKEKDRLDTGSYDRNFPTCLSFIFCFLKHTFPADIQEYSSMHDSNSK